MQRLAFAGRSSGVIFASLLLLAVSAASAEDRWVTDEFEVMLRTGKSTDNAILRQLKSGTRVDVLEDDKAEGYTRVRIDSGVEGWVLARYLQKTQTGRLRVAELEARAQAGDEQLVALRGQLETVTQERQQLQNQLGELQGNYTSNQTELERITALSSGTIKLDEQNRQLKLKLVEIQQRLDELEAENMQLSGRGNREWFLAGGGVLTVGLLLGLVIPRIRWRKKSSWGGL
jgi:SH3 domain protein